MSDTRDIITAGKAVHERDALRTEIERLLSVCKDKTVLLEDAYAQNERLLAQNTEAAAFLDNMAEWVGKDDHWLERSRMAADCRAMAAQLRAPEGK